MSRSVELLIGDELCRTSFGDFSEETMRRIAARITRKLGPADVTRLRRAMAGGESDLRQAIGDYLAAWDEGNAAVPDRLP